MTMQSTLARILRRAIQHTYSQRKTAALAALQRQPIVRHDAVIHETAIDLLPDVPSEQGFVVQTYDCGFLRDAWFFVDEWRVPLSGDEIATVLAVAETCTTPTPNTGTAVTATVAAEENGAGERSPR